METEATEATEGMILTILAQVGRGVHVPVAASAVLVTVLKGVTVRKQEIGEILVALIKIVILDGVTEVFVVTLKIMELLVLQIENALQRIVRGEFAKNRETMEIIVLTNLSAPLAFIVIEITRVSDKERPVALVPIVTIVLREIVIN